MHTDDDPAHRVRCTRWNEIDVTEVVRVEESREPIDVGETVLEVTNMRKYYKVRDRSFSALLSGGAVREVKANESISFRAGEGETVAIVGESGCGKSTFAKVLMGLETATDGEVRLDGNRPRRHSGQQTYGGAALLAADGVPEPERHAQPVPLGRLPDRPGDQALRHRTQFGQAAGAGAGAVGYGEAAAHLCFAKAASTLGRPEAAGGHRPRLRRQPQDGDCGRADLGARRFGGRRGDGAADGHSARAPHHAALHQPRSSRRSAISPTGWW